MKVKALGLGFRCNHKTLFFCMTSYGVVYVLQSCEDQRASMVELFVFLMKGQRLGVLDFGIRDKVRILGF